MFSVLFNKYRVSSLLGTGTATATDQTETQQTGNGDISGTHTIDWQETGYGQLEDRARRVENPKLGLLMVKRIQEEVCVFIP